MENRIEALLDLVGTEPSDGADDHPGSSVRGCQLLARCVAQPDRVLARL